MLYNVYPRTFDLTDVTGVMNICDRHMGAIAMRVSCFLICLSTVLCARASGLAHSRLPPRLHCDSFDLEGPPHLYNRPCRLRPPSSERKFAGGASTFTCPALPRDKYSAANAQHQPTDDGNKKREKIQQILFH